MKKALIYALCLVVLMLTDTYAQQQVAPLRYPQDTVTDFGFGLDIKPVVLGNGDLLVHIALLGNGFYRSKFLGRAEDGSLMYGRPERVDELSTAYSLARSIVIQNKVYYFFMDIAKKQWWQVEFENEDNLNVKTANPILIGSEPLIGGDFTIVSNREGTFLVKYSYVNEDKSYWPGKSNPWVYPPNPSIGFGKGFDEKGAWLGDKNKAQLSYAEAIQLKKWHFGTYKKVQLNGEPFTLEFYQSPSKIYEAELSSGKEQQLLLTWGIDRMSLYDTGIIDGVLHLFEKKLPKGIPPITQEIYSGAYATSTRPLYPDHKGRYGFILGGNPGILVEYYYHAGKKEWDIRPVKMKGGDLHIQTLAAVQWVDWDGDGVADIIGGDSSGFIWFFRNSGTASSPLWEPAVKLEADHRIIQHQAGEQGSIQGPNERRWGYVQPLVVDWDGDGLLDIVCNDVTGQYQWYQNIGSAREPKLAPIQALRYGDHSFKGAWRSKPVTIPSMYLPAKEKLMPLIAINSQGLLCRYGRTGGDVGRLVDEEILRWQDDVPIKIVGEAGHEGRATLSICDIDQDGNWDILFGQGIHLSQSRAVAEAKPYATAYVMRNVGTNERPVFDRPKALCHDGDRAINMDRHGCWVSPIVTQDGALEELLVGGEDGRFYLFKNIKVCP
ncbi:FG-GAP repeat domain-containing protein [Sphingobacterium psychroaquaticum]|uniref:FG-GAP repeat domain-containing protein n=1 Tax=Sphingobacterium psychroaquaticum TaxID=561061 RepID=UPI00141B03C1|nr:VCBS repeat-containing protein [Sphingobacterium psychroaquaticum]